MRGYIRTCSRLKNENLCVLGSKQLGLYFLRLQDPTAGCDVGTKENKKKKTKTKKTKDGRESRGERVRRRKRKDRRTNSFTIGET